MSAFLNIELERKGQLGPILFSIPLVAAYYWLFADAHLLAAAFNAGLVTLAALLAFYVASWITHRLYTHLIVGSVLLFAGSTLWTLWRLFVMNLTLRQDGVDQFVNGVPTVEGLAAIAAHQLVATMIIGAVILLVYWRVWRKGPPMRVPPSA